MAQFEVWYFIDPHGHLIQHTENDGYAFLRHGACARDHVADIDRMSAPELRKALRALLATLRQGGPGR